MVVVSCYQGNTNMGKVTCDDKSADQLKVGKLGKVFLHFSKTSAALFHHKILSFPQTPTGKISKEHHYQCCQ